MEKKAYSPTLSVHCPCDMDDYHNLPSSTCPPSGQDNNDLDNAGAHTPAYTLAVNSDAFISTHGTPSTIQVINPRVMIMGMNLVQNHQTDIVS